jgi:hypothetical protein
MTIATKKKKKIEINFVVVVVVVDFSLIDHNLE